MTDRLRVREIDDDEGRRLVRIVRRGSGSVVTWRRAQIVLLSGSQALRQARLRVIVAKFVRAWESADLDALVALLTDDVFISMPPMPFQYEGQDVAARFCASMFGAGRRFDLVPTRANGQPAFGVDMRAPDGIRRGTGLYVLALTGDRICAMTRFEASVLPWFGLPRSLPSR